MSSDFYSILGVTPSAEDVVIRAAYRALIRHYHPDTNPDPEAQRRAREITAAFAVLGDPAKRAEYDGRAAGPELWSAEEARMPPDRQPRPAMRGIGIASASLALALAVAVWAWPQPDPPKTRGTILQNRPATARPQPIVELDPESERLAKLRGDPPAVAPPPTSVDEAQPAESSFAPIDSQPPLRSEPARLAAAPPKRAVAPAAHLATAASAVTVPQKPKPSPTAEASAGCRPGGSVGVSAGCKNERIATLDRMAAGFFSQSMAHADAAKKELLMSSHTRSAETRSACHSDSCVSDAYLRQMREISAIMENREGSTK